MDNKQILEQNYRASYESARRYLDQNNLSAARDYFKKALSAAISLTESSRGAEREKYLREANVMAQMIEKINIKYKIAEEESKRKQENAEEEKSKTQKSAKKQEKEDQPVKKLSVDEALAQLSELEGLRKVKTTVQDMLAEIQYNKMRERQGLPVTVKSHHMVFMGNPGTGKTTVARIMAQVFCSLGLLSKGHLVEVQRSDLVAGYVGQTAIKTQEFVKKALGGVLFIDEAYSLAQGGGNDFGQEAINTVLKGMEDHRDDLVVIVAGYSNLMHKFIDSNPGLKSRFVNYIEFEDYNGTELYNIFRRLCAKNEYLTDPRADALLRDFFMRYYENRNQNFGNARDVRNFFQLMETRHGRRIIALGNAATRQDIVTILPEDVPFAVR